VLDGLRPADVRREAVKTLQGLTGQNLGENKKKWEEWLKGR
jgi:hypothetical protein